MTMHVLPSADLCTGCGACAARKGGCIAMAPDAEGFLHPGVASDKCNGCDLCRRACPVNKAGSADGENAAGPLQVLAAWHLDEVIRAESSSGGVFTALADSVLSRGGVVVGAAFDDELAVRHLMIESPADLHRLRGSKYVQSEITPSLYRQVRELLDLRRPVLFSGTPCQVAGLRSFLPKRYDNLLCCDLACHGAPSPLVWERYLQSKRSEGKDLAQVNFRDKKEGWKNYLLHHMLRDGRSEYSAPLHDPYMAAFLRDYSLRPSCYECPFANLQRPGDLTLADFWGVENSHPEYDREDRGTSLVLVNSEQGQKWLESCRDRLFLGDASLEAAVTGNPVLVRPSSRPPERATFYDDLKTIPFPAVVRKYRLYPPSTVDKVVRRLKRLVKRLLP